MLDNIEFVFVHSYSSRSCNWREVVLGTEHLEGRLTKGVRLSRELSVPVFADDALDGDNRAIYQEYGVGNFKPTHCTRDEVRSALDYSQARRVLFVTSTDHLPRVVRDAMALGGVNALFAASGVPCSTKGPGAAEVIESPAIGSTSV